MNTYMTTAQVLKAADISQQKMADLFGIKQPTVSYRVDKEKPISAEESLLLEAEYGLSRHITRPDIFGAEAA